MFQKLPNGRGIRRDIRHYIVGFDEDKHGEFIDEFFDILESTINKMESIFDKGNTLEVNKNAIIQVLGLNDDENKDKIVNDLIENGRQSLTNYKDDIPPGIYNKLMNGNDSQLIKLLK